jgi:hypothetical protein
VLDARDFGTRTGSNAGTLIQAAHDSALCPSTGCVIDARGFGATDTIAGLSITKSVCLDFGATTFSVTATMTWTNIVGPCLIGAANGQYGLGTNFTWAGNNSTAMFRLISVAKGTFRDFSVGANTSFPLTAFFTSERGATGNPTANVFSNITGDGESGQVTNGFAWVTGAGGDAGNDHFEFDNVEFDNYSNACFYNTGTQSQIHTFIHTNCSSNGYGSYGYQGTGSFSGYDMAFGDDTVADFALTPNNGVFLSNPFSIGSNRFMTDGASSGNAFPVTVINGNFAATGLNADGKVVILGAAGPYNFTNFQVTAVTSGVPAQLNSISSYAVPHCDGCNITYSSLANPYTGALGWELTGCSSVGDGPPVCISDTFPHGLNIGSATISQSGLGTFPGGLVTTQGNPAQVGLYESDTFSGTSLNANWAVAPGSFVVASGSVSSTSTGISGSLWNVNTFPADQFVQATLTQLPTSTAFVGLGVRLNGSLTTGYEAAIKASTVQVFSIAGSQIGTTYSGTISLGDVYSLTAIGTTVTLTRNGTPICGSPIIDGSATSGQPGLRFYQPSLLTSGSISTWSAGSYVYVSSGGMGNLALGTTAGGTDGSLTLKTVTTSGAVSTATLATTGLLTSYDSLTTAGLGVPVILGATSQKSETGTADASVLAVTPASVAGSYGVNYSASVASATSGVISFTLSWTDSNGNAQSAIAMPMFQQATAAPALTFTTSAAGNYSGTFRFDVNNAGAAITVKWVGGGSTAAKVSAVVERLQ